MTATAAREARVALVTGASAGIGKSIVRRLLQQGCGRSQLPGH